MFYPTPLLRQIRAKKIFKNRINTIGIHDQSVVTWLDKLSRKGGTCEEKVPDERTIRLLQQYRLIESRREASCEESVRQAVPLPFVTAINLELTYSCNLSCSHCLQSGLRKYRECGWLSTEAANKVIDDAWFAGLLSSGVNVTGGEVFSKESNLPAILEKSKAMSLDVRVNTNGWWGGKTNIDIGGRLFASSKEVLNWLKAHNVISLALSFDSRYVQYPKLLENVIKLINECEFTGLNYEIIAAGFYSIPAVDRNSLLSRIKSAGIDPESISYQSTDIVDIGGGKINDKSALNLNAVTNFKLFSGCMGKGFLRPSFLHINPDGGVRSCIYAPGSGALGNVYTETLLDVVNNFLNNPVVKFLSESNINEYVNKYFKPHLDIYRAIKHPCALSVLMSRFVEEYEKQEAGIRAIHMKIADEYNLRSAVK